MLRGHSSYALAIRVLPILVADEYEPPVGESRLGEGVDEIVLSLFRSPASNVKNVPSASDSKFPKYIM